MFKTVKIAATAELIEKKSRFIAHVKPVQTEEDAISFLNEIRSRYSDARHNVFAYSIQQNNLVRFSDDGEPSKTAGPPVLDVILREEITNVIIVVTRYFGGTLLGTGGLVRAYGSVAKLGVDNAQICIITPCCVFLCECDYGDWGKLSDILQNTVILNTEYADKVLVTFAVAKDEADCFLSNLKDIFSGQLAPMQLDDMDIAL